MASATPRKVKVKYNSRDTRMSALTAHPSLKLLLLSVPSPLLLKLILMSSSPTAMVSSQALTAALNLTMVSLLLAMVKKENRNIGSLRIHGEVTGVRMVTSELLGKLALMLESVVSNPSLPTLKSEKKLSLFS
jgi:uncharacterized membrane protein